MEIEPNDGLADGAVEQSAPVDAAELLHSVPEQAMSLNVRLEAETGLVRLDFSRATNSVSMDATAARAMAKALRQAANEAERLVRPEKGNAFRHARRGSRW